MFFFFSPQLYKEQYLSSVIEPKPPELSYNQENLAAFYHCIKLKRKKKFLQKQEVNKGC